VTNKQPALFDDQVTEPTDLTPLTLDGPPLRVVYFDMMELDGHVTEDTRPCLVRCDEGQRNVKTVRKLTTLCERACTTATRTSAIPPLKLTYCNACQSRAGNGVLK
jgi:hypothetical protein